MNTFSRAMIIFFALLLFSALPAIMNSGLKIQTGDQADRVSQTAAKTGAPAPQSTGTDVMGAIEVAFDPHTFLGGSTASDEGYRIVLDSNGNIYVTGRSYATWGTPVSPHSGGQDAFIVKLNASGILQWNTFLGGANTDIGYDIAVDTTGYIYVAGRSYATWGSPVNPHAGSSDAFVAKLDGSGALQWHTFLGQSGYDWGGWIALDKSGGLYVGGASDATWGSPIVAFTGGRDGFVAKLNASGALQWNTFIGSSANDYATDVASDANGDAYVTGYSYGTWGTPVRPYDLGADNFVAKLNGNGVLQWNTFLGGSDLDAQGSLAVDLNGNIYVTGQSWQTWGSPVNPYPGSLAVFAAKLNGSGVLQWNTFMGSTGYNDSRGIAADGRGNVFVAGSSDGGWGSPLRAYTSGYDGFVVKLNGSGALVWNAFLGTTGDDECMAIAVESNGDAYAAGYSDATWGSPIRPYGDLRDAFVTKMTEIPIWKPRHAAGDFDGDGTEELAVDFGAAGIYLYDNGAWSQISSSNPESLLAADVDGDNVGELIADLGATGLWLWNAGAWNPLSGVNVEGLAAGDPDADGTDEIVGDFGSVGLWLYNGGAWTQLSGVNADYVTVENVDGGGGDEIFGDFGPTGLWVWNSGTWGILSGLNPDYVITGQQSGACFVLGDFGPTGLWMWSMPGLCTQLSGLDADDMTAANTDGDTEDEVVGDFGATGLWHCEGGLWTGSGFTWTILSGLNADFMIRTNVDSDAQDELAADFGAIGLWLWNAGSWSQISGVNPEYLLSTDIDGDNADEIFADFGSLGLWLWNAGAWSQISAMNPD